MMDRLHKIVEERKKKAENNHQYEDLSKERLWTIIESKCKTIMIGALDQFEKKFGKSWGHKKMGLTEKERIISDMWKECRKEILDKGHHHIRTLEKELDEYNITWNRKNYKAD